MQFHFGETYRPFAPADSVDDKTQGLGQRADRQQDSRWLPAEVHKPRNYTVKNRLDLEEESTPMLYELLRTAASKGQVRLVEQIVELLVKDRQEQPNLRLYGSLILANVDTEDGTVARVNTWLEEMAVEGLTMDVGVCHDVLKVLSVHLDYLLRADILAYMQERWLTLSPGGHHDVAAGLLREGQFELATERMAHMRREGIKIEEWLKDMAILMLIEAEELDEALHLMKDRLADGELNISKTVWYHLLDQGSAFYNHDVTTYAWNAKVAIGHINPSSGICFNVLRTAARAGDARLATDVFRVLSQRSTVFSANHYEQLLSTYLSTTPPDLRAALSVLTIMASTKLEPTIATTRPIYEHLQQQPPDETRRAFDLLTELHASGRRIPVAAMNVLIESHVSRSSPNFKDALELYKYMHTFELKPAVGKPRQVYPTIETFNLLFRGARKVTPPAFSTAMFLASELLALGIRPDSLTYDRLVGVSLEAGEVDCAYRYFDEMESLGWALRPGVARALAKALAEMKDERCWEVLQRYQDRGEPLGGMRRDVELLWAKHEANEEGLERHDEQKLGEVVKVESGSLASAS